MQEARVHRIARREVSSVKVTGPWVVDTRDGSAERLLFASTVCDHIHASQLYVHQLTGDIKELLSGRSLGKHAYCSTENKWLGGSPKQSDLLAGEGTDKARATIMAIHDVASSR
jgi:hypothetical protein